jgi:hypothetical protein
MIDLAEYGPPIIFFLGKIFASSFAIRFNLKTFRIAKQIQQQAASEVLEWEFWGRRDRVCQFLFRPSELLEPNDSIALCNSKQHLVAHRQTMWRCVLLGWGIMLGTLVGGVLFVVVLSQLAN